MQRLLTNRAARRRATAGILTAAESDLLARPLPSRKADVRWWPAEVPLLDEAEVRLHGVRTTYGHIIADEAQDLSAMELRAVARLRVASLTGQRLVLPTSVVAAQVPVRYGRLPVVDRRFVRYAHKLGLQVHVWTIDDPERMHELLDLGVDGIMTDNIGGLRKVLEERGQWHPVRTAAAA